jgi:hypothetical protein
VSTSVATVPSPQSRGIGRPAGWLLPLMLALALAAGWFARTAWTGDGRLRIVGRTSGVVSVVNITGAKFCLQPHDGSAQRCGVAYERRDSPPLAVGDDVSVTIAELKTANGATEVFILER